ncbi:cytochrome P450 [Allokutzneria sp. A3M-2-11 16]|uniref:cytochrome P450 n=1 Tax=Allokutzneria sp. A3M-2-11 16 TaxID=2962043 RepID=UPI0020B66B19|nr:cytochrome P450 [Allokutzneria sp. A3M-2-11 16]MCP3801336.1 cytochrome P450 [Allokutzneria sp. A3M-2-11 16]
MDTAPVAPGRRLLAGHALKLWREPLDFFRSLPQHGGVVRIGLGPKNAFVVNDQDLLHEMLVGKAELYPQGLLSEKMKPLLGDASSTLSGEEHRKRRRMMAPAFRQQRVNGYVALMTELSEQRGAQWRADEPFSLRTDMNDLALMTVITALLSSEASKDAVAELHELLPVFLKGLFRRLVLPGFLLDLIPTKGNRGFTTSVRRMREITEEVIRAYRADSTDRGDVLSIMVRVRDEETGDTFTDSQILNEIMALVLAGTETTGNMMTFAFQNLARRPDVEARMHAELDEVLGGRPVTADDIPRLVLTQRVVDECLRMYCPWMLTRQAAEETELGGVRIPKDAFMIYSPNTVCRDERWYPEPHRWDPDRWNTDRQPPKRSWIPFGAGGHICPGNIFGRVEMIVHIATIAARWRLRPEIDELDPGAPVTEIGSAAVVHPDDTPMIPTRRTTT